MRRRTFLGLVALALVPSLARAGGEINVEEILNDPAAPVGGDPHGDVTIVAFLDYNCTFCKKAAPALEKVLAEDGHIRLVYKDWPIRTPASVVGARLALAAKYQDRYEAAHHAMMGLKGVSTADQLRAALAAAGLDMRRLDADAAAHEADIAALLKRNKAEAQALGLEGTPVFLVGPFKVAAALEEDEFRQVVAETRARQKGVDGQ